MLHAVAQLAEHGVRDIERVLRHKIHTHPLGADQPHDLLYLVEQGLGRIVKEQMGLVKKEHQFGFVDITDLGQVLEQFGQHPEQKGRIQLGRIHQLVGGEDVDHAGAPAVGLHQVGDVERGLCEQLVAALLLDLEQAALYRADRCGRDIAVGGGELLGVLAHVLQHRAQVLQVEQQQALVVGDLEHQAEHTLLGVVEIEHATEQQRAHARHRGAYRVALLPEHVPEHRRAGGESEPFQTQRVDALLQFWRHRARLREARQVAFDIGHEHRHADGREALRQRLQGHRLARSGGAGDQPVAVGEGGQQCQFGGA